MDEESCTKTCIKEKEMMGSIHQPFYGTWVADFMQRQDAEKCMLGKYLNDKKMLFPLMEPIRPVFRSGLKTSDSVLSNTPFFFYLDRGNVQDLQTIRCMVGCSKAPTPR